MGNDNDVCYIIKIGFPGVRMWVSSNWPARKTGFRLVLKKTVWDRLLDTNRR